MRTSPRRAGLPALHAGGGEAAALGHEDDADGRVGDHLELDLLPEPAAELAGARRCPARSSFLCTNSALLRSISSTGTLETLLGQA